MNQQERQVISDIFDKLKQVESQPRDPEAERFIADLVARQPYAPYAMAQAIFVQEEALKQYNERVRELEARGGDEPAQGSGGFLSGLFGGGQDRASAAGRPRGSVPPVGGMGTAPQYGVQPQMPGAFGGGGGGFLRNAMATAAGVAGGAFLFQGLRGLFGGDETSRAAGFGDPAQMTDAAGDDGAGLGSADDNVSDASYDDGDFGSDIGDGGDWT